ncbi:MAG: hypothetical protein QF689_16755 [Candidatus Latescibacteria bacterium]|jgi:hypothetical protein|nr:hypothetical protein [Gemmatimonadaceae bacterium]MDP6016946.1 hypothetical protein [Candidatus Latescibacterota bacterium]MDP7450244.1 hypothetical protein [Candidatus Latescibacterota bacterium]HJP31795.1 hypothetical protein [Candidatus Latescibacterota bacterium]
MNTARILDYQLSSIGGFEEIVVDELGAVVGGRIQGLRVEHGEVGGVYFRTEASPRRLLQLGCPTAIEAVAAQAHDVTVGQPGLERVLRCLRSLPVAAVRRLAKACDEGVDVDHVELRVTLRGAHRFVAADVERLALPALHELGFQENPPPPGFRAMPLTIRVRKRRAFVTVLLGPRRPVGDPQREGWPGPARNCVSRVLDLDDELVVGGLPAPGGSGLSIAASDIVASAEHLPLRTGRLPVLLLVYDLDTHSAVDQLREAVRAVAPGGILGLLVRRSEQLAGLLHELELPLEVMATIPYYVRRRRCVLFLLERLELLSIESMT